jgi:NADH:ubiquinone oxidoreductase subunit E
MNANNKQVVLDMEPLDEILSSMPEVTQGDLIPLLQQIQTRYGYLPREVVTEMSRRTKIAISQIYGVATFYEQFHLEPHGKHVVRCCRGTACHVRGGEEVINTIERALGIKDGETTDDNLFTFETVACLGACALAPLMVVDGVYYGKMDPNKAKKVFDGLKASYMEGKN